MSPEDAPVNSNINRDGTVDGTAKAFFSGIDGLTDSDTP